MAVERIPSVNPKWKLNMSKKDETPKNNEEEYIIPPGAVNPKAKETEEWPEEPANLESSKEEVSETKTEETTEGSKVAEEPAEETQSLSREEIEEAFAVGKQLKDYQKSHPGWDPWEIERDYRIKTAELAEFKRSQPQKPEEKITEPDLSDVHPDDVAKIEKILKAKGFVSRKELNEIDQRKKVDFYEAEKSAQVNEFLRKYPQYLPKNDPKNMNWDAVLSEFNLYKLPQDPKRIGELLERAHRTVIKATVSPKNAAELLAQNKMNNLGKSTVQGSAPSVPKTTSRPTTKVSVEQARAHLKGWSDEEIAEMFGSSS